MARFLFTVEGRTAKNRRMLEFILPDDRDLSISPGDFFLGRIQAATRA